MAKILIGKIATYILNPIIILLFVIATIYLFYSIAEMIWGADSSDLEKKRTNVIYAIVGMLVMFSVYGILRLVLNTFGIPVPSFFGAS